MAREICARIAQPHAAAPTAALPPARLPAVIGNPTAIPPESPITAATRALSQLPPGQLLDMVIQRLRAALPTGAAVPEPKGVQFQLLPGVPPYAIALTTAPPDSTNNRARRARSAITAAAEVAGIAPVEVLVLADAVSQRMHATAARVGRHHQR